MRRSLDEPKILRASAPSMKIPPCRYWPCKPCRGAPSCLSTHRDATRKYRVPGHHPPNEWELSIPRFTAKTAAKYAHRRRTVRQRYGGPKPCQRRRNLLKRIHHFACLFALPRPHRLGDCPAAVCRRPIFKTGFSMTAPFPDPQTGLRAGLAALAAGAAQPYLWPPACRFAPRTRSRARKGQRHRDPPERPRACRGRLGPSSRRWTRRPSATT